MKTKRKARKKLLAIVSFIVQIYLKEIIMGLHTIIAKMSPELFAFLVITLIAIVITKCKYEK